MQKSYKNLRDILLQVSRKQIRERENILLNLHIPQLGEITCTKIMRGVTGKRLVCYAYQGKQEFVVKFFLHPSRAGKHWSISNRGLNLFKKKSILTPELFFSGYLKTENLYLIILKYLNNAISFTEGNNKNRKAYVQRMISCLAEQHKQGIIQMDANPGNFLLYQDKVYSLDGDHVHDLGNSVSKRKSLKNLAAFCSKLSTVCAFDLRASYSEYVKQRNWRNNKKDMLYLLVQVRLCTMQLSFRRISKICKRKMKLIK